MSNSPADNEQTPNPDVEQPANSTDDQKAAWNFTSESDTSVPMGETKPVQQPEPTPLSATEASPPAHHDPVSWTASEYIAHHKSPIWYITLVLIAVVVGAAIYLLTRDFIALGVVVAMAILFGVSAARPPRIQAYEINDKGVVIGAKHYDFSMFRSFSVVDDGPFSSITLLSTKRYMPPLSIYYPHEFEDKIVQKLSDALPFEHKEADFIEHLMRRIRF